MNKILLFSEKPQIFVLTLLLTAILFTSGKASAVGYCYAAKASSATVAADTARPTIDTLIVISNTTNMLTVKHNAHHFATYGSGVPNSKITCLQACVKFGVSTVAQENTSAAVYCQWSPEATTPKSGYGVTGVSEKWINITLPIL